MFDTNQLQRIDGMLRAGKNIDEVAKLEGMSRNTLILRIAQSGKRVHTVRMLEDIQLTRIEPGREAVAA